MKLGACTFYFVIVICGCSFESERQTDFKLKNPSAKKSVSTHREKFILQIKNKKAVVEFYSNRRAAKLVKHFLSFGQAPNKFKVTHSFPRKTLRIHYDSEDVSFYGKVISPIRHYSNLRGTLYMKSWSLNKDRIDPHRLFINLSDNRFNDGKTSVIGKVIKGMDFIDEISLRQRDSKGYFLKPFFCHFYKMKEP